MMRNILAAVLLLAVTSFSNVIENGSFNNGVDGWEVWTHDAVNANANLYQASGAGVVHVSDGGTEPWHVSLRYNGIPLQKGKYYEGSFDVTKTGQDGFMDIFFAIVSGRGTSEYYSEPQIVWSCDSSCVTFSFEMVNETDPNAMFCLFMGTIEETYVIDNFVLNEKSYYNDAPTINLLNRMYHNVEGDIPFAWKALDDKGIAGFEYRINGGSLTYTTERNVIIPALPAGDHYFEVRAIDNEGAKSAFFGHAFTSDATVSAAPIMSRAVSPITIQNSTSSLKINLETNEPVSVNVTDLKGRVIYSSTSLPANNIVTVDKTNIAAGLYVLNISTSDVTKAFKINF